MKWTTDGNVIERMDGVIMHLTGLRTDAKGRLCRLIVDKLNQAEVPELVDQSRRRCSPVWKWARYGSRGGTGLGRSRFSKRRARLRRKGGISRSGRLLSAS